MPMGWCPRPASQTLSRPPERVSEAGILFRGALSLRIRFCYKILWKRRCSRRNMRQMLTCPGRGEGFVPGFRVRVMGCARGRGRGENGYRITLWSAGALPGKILHELPGMCCIIPARIRETVRRFSVLLAQQRPISLPAVRYDAAPVFLRAGASRRGKRRDPERSEGSRRANSLRPLNG